MIGVDVPGWVLLAAAICLGVGLWGGVIQHGHTSITDGGTLGSSAIPALAAFDRVQRTSGDVTTTSTSMVDLTGALINLTTTARPVLVTFLGTGSLALAAVDRSLYIGCMIDGVAQTGNSSPAMTTPANFSLLQSVGFSFLSAALTAAAHTFKIQWAVSSGTGTINGTSGLPYVFGVQEVR